MSVTTARPHTIQCQQGPETVTATSPVPGLYVYEIPGTVDQPSLLRWRVGHHSGLVIAAAMYEGDAIRGAQKIADLADWTLPVDELRRDVSPTELYDAISWASCDHPAYA
ncbi:MULTISPECIES: hypothetical protein [Streptomyces]|uniref:Uncharacterized protein n=1 Tax=Streptomyces dengpaensis TaxID=2049881 RepID=A0ABM6SYX7_9ACTN|nr:MULTISPECIES: hypothetical protein [Streptomyces]AVH59923.1 hypothetical protein C4B68_33780 [Streptomyces dengpaensis]PIB09558.1 hypothetical protein B1C81_10455 [Streptomyces sp. HG99]